VFRMIEREKRQGIQITYDSFRTFDLNWGRVGWYKQGE